MFKTLAKSGLANFRLVQLRRIAPWPQQAAFSNHPRLNDNLPGFRRPAAAGKRRTPTPALACHWVVRDGRLECRRRHTRPRVRCTPAFRARERLRTIDAAIAQPCAGRMSKRPTWMTERYPHAPRFSEKAIDHPPAGFGPGGAALLHRGLRRDSSGRAVRGAVVVERQSSGAAVGGANRQVGSQ